MLKTAPERLDRNRQAAPQVFDRLREAIVSLVLPPGTALSRVAIAAQFGLSQTPIRDALMRLREEDLVDVFPQHATVVSRIDVKLAQQAHFLRQAVELEIVRALALARDEQLVGELDRAVTQQQQFANAGDFAKFMAADNEFHRQLYAATDKHELWVLIRSRSGHIDRLRRLHLPTPGKAQDIVRRHRMIVKAIELEPAGRCPVAPAKAPVRDAGLPGADPRPLSGVPQRLTLSTSSTTRSAACSAESSAVRRTSAGSSGGS